MIHQRIFPKKTIFNRKMRMPAVKFYQFWGHLKQPPTPSGCLALSVDSSCIYHILTLTSGIASLLRRYPVVFLTNRNITEDARYQWDHLGFNVPNFIPINGWWFEPSWKIWVNGKDYPIYYGKNVWNHQPVIGMETMSHVIPQFMMIYWT